MADNKPIPTIFLSYAWANRADADAIDEDFKRIGITFVRDVRDAKYRTSIKEFMQRIGSEDFAVMLISDEFLHSENCMHEVTELLGTHSFEKRVLPVLIGDAGGIFQPAKRALIYTYWKEQQTIKEVLHAQHPGDDFWEEVKKVRNIVQHLDDFFATIKYLSAKGLEALKEENYKSVLDVVGFDKDYVLNRVLVISRMEDEEDQEIALEYLLLDHYYNHFIWFQKSRLANKQQAYKKEREYLKQAISVNPKYSIAHNNLALLLTDHFAEHDRAKDHYLEALRINPNHAEVHNNLALLLTDHFGEYDTAKDHYLEALRINPNFVFAYNNLAPLLAGRFGEHNIAKEYLLEALRINPNYAEAHYNLALLLTDHFGEHNAAKEHYLEALRINPNYVEIHNNLALLLTNHFGEYDTARKHYLEALRINPDFAHAHNNLALLYTDHFGEHNTAKKHYLEAIRLEPNYANAYFNLAILLFKAFNDLPQAQHHYQKSIELDSAMKTDERHEYFQIGSH